MLLSFKRAEGTKEHRQQSQAQRPPPSQPAVKVEGPEEKEERLHLAHPPFGRPESAAGLAHTRSLTWGRAGAEAAAPVPPRIPARAAPAPHRPPAALTPLRAPRAAGRGRWRPRGPGEPRCRRRPPPGCFPPHGSPPARAAERPRRAGRAERRGCSGRLAAAASPSSCRRLMCPPSPGSLLPGRRRSSSPLSCSARGPLRTPPAGRQRTWGGYRALSATAAGRGAAAAAQPPQEAERRGHLGGCGAARRRRGSRKGREARNAAGGYPVGRWLGSRSAPFPAPRRPLPHGPALPRRRGRASPGNPAPSRGTGWASRGRGCWRRERFAAVRSSRSAAAGGAARHCSRSSRDRRPELVREA